ncbi:FAD/NAD(P)-binding protein [Glycomyces xiaoerkulensis]|uniref:FAD/NAD(P)-binding protein n=1 Tax=Glycomyces xiaoerkulensis TaxID=2038139 RepID=UPI000C25C298|nr:FAD/NAD(P)-binding protein [Glycomyces xiaoerkulensis]
MKIAVIGAGASAVSLLDALAQRWESPAEITVFEPAPDLWRGRPYRDDTPAVRVNAPPVEMSVRDGDPAHFERWLDRHFGGERDCAPDPFSGDRFVPRSRFGSYLDSSAASAIARLEAANSEVTIHRSTVTGLLRTTHQVVARDSAGRFQPFDACVMCVGVASPADHYGLSGQEGFVPDPYPAAAKLSRIDPSHDVAVLGSGLTAVDAVLSLVHRGHRGRIALVSRQGVLPAVRQSRVEHRLRHFTVPRLRELARRGRMRLEALTDLMRTELAAAGHGTAAIEREFGRFGSESAADRLRRHLAAVDDSDIGMRVLQQAVPETGPDVWPALPAGERDLVLRDYYRHLMSLCCPMPPSSASILLRLMEYGQLEVLSGLAGVRPERRGFTVAASGSLRRFDTVVNGVGASASRVPPRAATLVDSLLRSGAAQRHPHGGLAIDPATSRVVSVRGPDPRLYALGDLAAGTLFFTFGIPSLVDRARDIVGALERERAAADRRRAVHAM